MSDRRRWMIRSALAAGTVLGVSALRDAPAAAAAAPGFGGISLLNRLRIMEEVARYSWAWDSGDFEEYLGRYFEDGYLEHPHPDGSAGRFVGRAAIREFLERNVKDRPNNSYGLQHLLTSQVLTADGANVRLQAYCDVLRHEFQRNYWPHGPSFRMGTWHALYGQREDGEWRLRGLTVKMWTDTAFVSGTAIQNRPPGSPGT